MTDNPFENLDIETEEQLNAEIKIYNLIILDRSGSMNQVKDVTISGLNEQLNSIRSSQEKYPEQKQIVCFATFNDDVDCSNKWNRSIDTIDNFTSEDYFPAGLTALHDAIGIGINKLKNEIREELKNRTSTIMVSIFTDGFENRSKEYNGTQAKELIEEVKKTGLWSVSFIGCGDENKVFEIASSYGIGKGDTLNYNHGENGVKMAFSAMAQSRAIKCSMYSETFSKNLDAESLQAELSKVNNEEGLFEDKK